MSIEGFPPSSFSVLFKYLYCYYYNLYQGHGTMLAIEIQCGCVNKIDKAVVLKKFRETWWKHLGLNEIIGKKFLVIKWLIGKKHSSWYIVCTQTLFLCISIHSHFQIADNTWAPVDLCPYWVIYGNEQQCANRLDNGRALCSHVP